MVNVWKIFLVMSLTGSHLCLGAVIPENIVQSLRSGYSKEELRLLDHDLEWIRQLVFGDKKAPKNRMPVYLASAGAPGARKSTILESYLYTRQEFSDAIYVDPDQRALKFMVNTYYDRGLNNYKISQSKDYQTAQKAAYDHWRAGSNYIANTLLNEAIAGGFDIAHGTTLTGPHSGALLKKIKDAGYQIILVLCGAEDSLRVETVRYRNEVQGFYQTDPGDVKDKALLFPQRLKDYFDHADELWIHWSEQLTSPLSPAAHFFLNGKKAEIFSKDQFARFVKKLDKDGAGQASLAGWKKLVRDKGISEETLK